MGEFTIQTAIHLFGHSEICSVAMIAPVVLIRCQCIHPVWIIWDNLIEEIDWVCPLRQLLDLQIQPAYSMSSKCNLQGRLWDAEHQISEYYSWWYYS
jgi:hypothetical protein